MRKRGLCCGPCVCLSVRLSVTLVYCIQMAEDIVKLLSRPDFGADPDFDADSGIFAEFLATVE